MTADELNRFIFTVIFQGEELSQASPCASILALMITLSVCLRVLLSQGDPSLYHSVCGLFQPLVSHPPTVATAGEHCSKQPLHQICPSWHVYAFVCICDMSCRSASTQTPG